MNCSLSSYVIITVGMCMHSSHRLKMSSGLLVDLHLMHTMRRSQDIIRLFAGNLVLAFVMEIFVCLRRSYRHCKVVLTGVSGVVILQTGSSF